MAASCCAQPALEASSFVPKAIKQTRPSPNQGVTAYLVRWEKSTSKDDPPKECSLWMTTKEVEVCCPSLREGAQGSVVEAAVVSESDSSVPAPIPDELGGPSGMETEEKDLAGAYDEEMREDVRRTVVRLKRFLYQEDLSSKMQNIIESQLRVLTEYAGIRCMAVHFQECGAVDLLLQMIAQGDNEHWETVSEILTSLAVHDVSNGMRILLTMMEHNFATDGWSAKKVREKQEFYLELFRDNFADEELDHNRQLSLSMPDVPIALAYSIVKQYLTVDSLMDKSSHIGVFPLSCDEGGEGQSTPTQALKKQESFELFHAVNQLLWDILRIFKWYKIPAGGAGEGNVVGSPIVLGQSKRMRLRKKVYKTRSDFQSDSEYGNYVKSVMKRGMRVKAIRSYDGVGEGDLGTFQSGSDSAVVPARVMWENYGSLIYFAWHNLEIMPSKEERGIYYESVPEDNTAANTLSYLLCQKPSQLLRGCDGDTPSSPSLGSSGGGHAANVAHWWEVLSAVQGLTQETQQHLFTLLGAESYDELVSMQPSMKEIAAVVQCLKEHHPERMVRTYSVECLPKYRALVPEVAPERVWERVKKQWKEARSTLQPGRDVSPYPDPFWEEIPKSSRATIARTVQKCFGPANNFRGSDLLLSVHSYQETVLVLYGVKSCADVPKQQQRKREVLRVIDRVLFGDEDLSNLSPITDVFEAAVLGEGEGEVTNADIMSALLLLRILIGQMSSRVEECVLSGSLDLLLRLIELSKGSPLLQGMGLQCLNAHFNSFDLSELSSEMMQVASKGTQSAKQKGDTLLNSLLAVLSSLVVHPLATKQGYGGHLKPMWDTAVEVAKYINHSLDEWMQCLFVSAVAGSMIIFGLVMQRDADLRKAMQEWDVNEGVQALMDLAREWDSCGNITGAVDTLLPQSVHVPPHQPLGPVEQVVATAENNGKSSSEFMDVIFLLIHQQIPANQFGVLMDRILTYLSAAHCKHPPHPPGVVKEATVHCQERAEMFVANWGPAAVVDLMEKRQEDLRSGEAINVLRMFICLSNVSSQMCCELVLQGMLTVVHNLLSSLCKEHCTVAKWTLCLLWKLMEFADVRAIMDAESVETLVSELRTPWPTLSSNIKDLLEVLPVSVWNRSVTGNRQALAYVLTGLHNWVLSAMEQGRRDQRVPAIPLFHHYVSCIAQGNVGSKAVAGSECWEELTVSSCFYSKSKLTDGLSSTYWESSAEVGKNWIHLKMKSRTIIKKLCIAVSSSDRSYVPKVIDVEGGSAPSVLRVLRTVNVPGGTHGTVTLLKKQDWHYRHIFIRIKECQHGGAATRIRGLDCRCRPVSVWPIFEDALSSRASLQHSVNVALCQSDSPAALDWFDRLVAAIRFEQELADAYFHTSGSRHGLGKAVMTFLIEPTVKAIVQTGCFGKLISQYSQSMEEPLHGSRLPHLFSSSSWRAGEASPLLLQAVHTTADQDSVLQMSRIRRLFNFVVQCHDSNSVPYSSMDMHMPWWSAFVREELSLILSNIKVTAPLEYIRSVSDVVQKLLRLCRELFADHLALVGEMVAEVGQILKENGQAESVKFCANLSSALHAHLKDPQTAPDSRDVVGRMALLQAVMPSEVVSVFKYFYWFHLTVRILRGEMYSLAVERNALSHVSCLAYADPKVLLDDVEKSASLMDKFCNSEPLEAVDRLAAQMGHRQALSSGVQAVYQKMALYRQGAFSALILAPEHIPVKLEVVPDLAVLPAPLKQFCTDYQNFYQSWHRRHARVHERTPFLQWTVSGWAVVEYRGQLYKVSTAQMLVLMQFNDVDSATPAVLQASTGLSTVLLRKVLSSLTTGRDALLYWKVTHSNDMGKNSVVSLRGVKGKGKQSRVTQGCVVMSHEDEFSSKLTVDAFEEQGLKQLFTKRQSIIDSLVVHALKKQKRMGVDRIATLVVTACRAGHSTGGRSFARFECSVDDALASVDRLAFSGYLERDRESPQVIVYKEESCDLPQPTRPPCTEALPTPSCKVAEGGMRRKRSGPTSQPPTKMRKIQLDSSPQKIVATGGDAVSQFCDLSFLPASLQWSQTLKFNDLLKHIQQLVDKVAEVASLSAAEAELLLHHLKWNKDELLNRYLSDHNNILLTEAGLRPDMDRPQPIEGVESVECPVCLESFADTTLSLTCGHKCCTDCWVGHLQTQAGLSQLLQAPCPVPECNVRCTRDMFQTVFAGHQSLDEILHKFSLAVLRSFVDCHPNFTWCCAPVSCDGILQRTEGVPSGLCTKCSWTSCFYCNFTESHEPASCSEMLRWMEAGGFCEGMDSDHKSKLLEKTIAKKCPRCYIPIQKNEGCLHMRCKCGFEFCWRCMKVWGPDHTDFFKCTAQISREAEVLQKFAQYNTKCMEYHKLKVFASDMCTAVLMTPVRWLPHSQLLLLVEACLCLKACYKDLAYAQVAEYLKPKDSLDYLTHQIHVLESDTKALQLLLDSILVKVPPVVGMAAMSELHGAECLKLVHRLTSVHVNLELGAQQRYQMLDVSVTEPCCDCSNVALKNRDQQAESQKGVQDRATQHAAGTTMDSEASADHSPPTYIPAPTVALLSDDSLESPEAVDSDGDEEAAISDLEGDYSDNYSADYDDDELSSDEDGLYDSEDHDCDCECCRNAIFHFPPLL